MCRRHSETTDTAIGASMWRILIIEDSPTNMMLTVEILTNAGHATLQAVNGGQGIQLARQEHPDVILLDMQLPDMNGLEVASIMKAEPGTRDIPVIALTAFAMHGDRERMLQAGCDGYIEKPIRYKTFLEEIDAVTRKNGKA
jgi:two-component system cell cycle response regulator DivK